MTTAAITLEPYVTDLAIVPVERRLYWQRFLGEAQSALQAADADLVRTWAVNTLGSSIEVISRRTMAIWDLVRAVAKGVWGEFVQAWKALREGKFGTYAKDLCVRAWNRLKALWKRIQEAFAQARSFVASLHSMDWAELSEVASAFVGAVIGFFLMGGTGRGGVIDADIKVLGIGSHRSIWFHSVFVGFAAEVALRSFFDLQRLLHTKLPRNHLPAWDRMLRISERFHEGMIRGSWLGVASHLAIDSHIDGWTPYKDLPVALPNWGHHLVMDANAAASGWFAWHWHDKVKRRFRKTDFSPARLVTRDGRIETLPVLA